MMERAMDQAHLDGNEAAAQFLRACLRGRWHEDSREMARRMAQGDDVDWDAALGLARRGDLAPLLYRVGREGGLLPPRVEAALRLDYLTTAARNMGLFHELARVLNHLALEAVPVMALKGAALAPAVYGNLALRPMCDIDLLVHEHDVPATLRALQGVGYEIILPTAYRCEVMLQRNQGWRVLLEVHWHLFVPFYYQYRIAMDWFWDTAQRLDVGEASTMMPGPEAQLLHLCGHLHLHHGGSDDARLLWLYDVAAVIARYEDEMDWEEMLARSQVYDLVVPVARTLRRVAEDWRAPIPAAVLADVLVMEPSEREKQVLKRLTAAPASAGQGFRAELAEIPSRKAQLRFVWRNLFPPAGYMEQIYGVRHRLLVPLYYPYRWMLGVRRAAE